ncbi:heavy metal translocating P-type ATPase [Desulfovibrio sp. PG-178-WT-4]|uniref:P-type Zn(2+) transporter n=1 Tax=Desulfovibrio porci TaxID=2605782 RepID=A0A6L5XJC9_9BACT|nr:heavy metal translocating P-type ATPase [Desulfovibrio porci]MSS27296.1 heavy metal translocating P-type ATPase [Desulfovibrio porci]
MSFFIIHELQGLNGTATGRMRVRADRPLPPPPAADLTRNLEELPGISDVRVNPRVGSVLFFYADRESRLSALRLLTVRDEAPAPDTPDNISDLLPEEPPAGGVLPLIRFFVIRPFLPRIWRVITSVAAAAPFLLKGVASLLRGRLSVDVLDAAAITASILMRDFRTVSVLTLLLGLGETLEYWTRRRSLDSLTESLALNVDSVWLLGEDGTEVSVPLSQVQKDDLVVVRDGGSIPVDGIVEDGCAVVNQSSMTGEPLGVPRAKGASVFAGTVVEEGRLVIRVSHVGDGTRLRQVVTFIEQSEALKAGIQGKTERLADLAVPFTFGLAALVWLITRNPMRAASVLLVDYSCALKLATPLAVLASMREGAGHGMVIKGGRYLEALCEADTLVFDKTGTLTNASPKVVEVIPAEGQQRDEVLRVMACLEEHFPHPVARAVVRKAQEENLQHEEEHAQVEYVVAHGVASSLHGKKLRVGSRHYIEHDEGVDVSPLEADIVRQAALGRSLLYLSEDGKLAGILAIEDPLRPEAAEVVETLRGMGFKRVLMLTGDDERTTRAVAASAGITEFRAQVLPADKARVVQELTDSGCKVLMVGDGINDAPALSASHVGVAMIDGTDLAREVANVLLTRPSLGGLIEARRLACGTLRRIHTNFAVTLTLNSLFLAGGLFMVLQPGLSALLHNLTTLGVSLNAMRPHLPAPEAPAMEGRA